MLTLLTADFGLVRARAEGLRKPSSKLAHALQTLSESEATLLKGKEGWRLAGAVLTRNWYRDLGKPARLRAGKRASLILRLVQGESASTELFETYEEFLSNLEADDEILQDAAELRASLRILELLGHEEGGVPTLDEIAALKNGERRALVARVARGIDASGL